MFDGFLKWCRKNKFWLFWVSITVIWFPVSFCIASYYTTSTRGLAFLLLAPLVVVGLYFTSKRTIALESQNEIDRNRLLTETFAKSIELLGNEQPAVKQGAIYALGKIANTNQEELTVIAMTLCAFIRHNKPALDSQNLKKSNNLQIDIEAAVKVIVNISKKLPKDGETKYDLSNIYLTYADFSRANLSNFNLSDSVFKSCIFEKTKFQDSNLVNANFENSNFKGSKFNQNTELQKADFSKTQNLSQEQVNISTGDQDTKLPSNLNRPSNWGD